MRKLIGFMLVLMLVAGAARAAEEYPYGPDSERHAGVPKGEVTHFTWTSKIFPGTTRDYWVYVPAQYNPAKPACVMVFQDGEGFMKEDGHSRVPIVFDNLIAKGEMPVTIGIFINPGVLKALSPDQQNRYNRSFEYDALSDRYARFLIQEILPEVGKKWNLSKNPDDRAISGLSSGGICAFTVAWTHPEAFHRVLSFIGSFTDLRGGDIYPALIRKTEPKPLRVFLQDGSSDLNLFAGDWWLANQTMASALKWAGYDVKFSTGDKDHDMIQGGPLMPDALRWLWRDYPQPIAKPAPNGTGNRSIAILDPKSDWEPVPIGTPIDARTSDLSGKHKATRMVVIDDGYSWIAANWESQRTEAAGLTADLTETSSLLTSSKGALRKSNPTGVFRLWQVSILRGRKNRAVCNSVSGGGSIHVRETQLSPSIQPCGERKSRQNWTAKVSPQHTPAGSTIAIPPATPYGTLIESDTKGNWTSRWSLYRTLTDFFCRRMDRCCTLTIPV